MQILQEFYRKNAERSRLTAEIDGNKESSRWMNMNEKLREGAGRESVKKENKLLRKQ